MENLMFEVYGQTKDKDFLNYLIEGKASQTQIDGAIWEYIFNNPSHKLQYCFNWQGFTVNQLISEVLKRQKTKQTV